MDISSALRDWYTLHKRDLPWRSTNSPYRIWLSEVILQQTRVNQGYAYYLRFIETYPTVHELAAALPDEVMKLWQGLGYYSRARNMHETAREIISRNGGIFPGTYEGLLKMKGIGPYTAAAIASLAYNEPVAVVDGNVLRVISRLFAISDPIDTPAGKKQVTEIAGKLLDRHEPAMHNQAMMELGALVCLPRNPHCHACPVSGFCLALQRGITQELPVKQGKRKVRSRYFNYIFLINDQGNTYIKKRTSRDIWHSLYEFPLIESSVHLKKEELFMHSDWVKIIGNERASVKGKPVRYKHLLTHQLLHCSFYRVEIDRLPPSIAETFTEVSIKILGRYPVPRLIENYLNDHVND